MYNQNQSVSICLNFVKHPLLPQRNGRLWTTLVKTRRTTGEITADGLLNKGVECLGACVMPQ
jgi:NADH:ubiquinone oxidoreductase subunit E